MTPQDFCYWLQGLFELSDVEDLTSRQVKTIKDHLNLVFAHSIDTPDPTGELQAAHDGKKLLTEDDKKDLVKQIEDVKKKIEFNRKNANPTYRC